MPTGAQLRVLQQERWRPLYRGRGGRLAACPHSASPEEPPSQQPGQVLSPMGLPCLMTLLLCNQNPPFCRNPAEQESLQETMVFKHLSVPGGGGVPGFKAAGYNGREKSPSQ